MKRRDLIKALGLGCIGVGIAPELLAKSLNRNSYAFAMKNVDDGLKDYLHKIQNFNEPHQDDVQIESNLIKTFESTVLRMRRLQKLVGHGNFHILSFQDGLAFARNYPDVGKFTKAELQFMEVVFYEDGERYGFFGQKPLKEITNKVKRKDVIKIPLSYFQIWCLAD